MELNELKNKAIIPVLNPGECIVLKARVKLPEKGVEGELLNEVIVLSKETGEREADSTGICTGMEGFGYTCPGSCSDTGEYSGNAI